MRLRTAILAATVSLLPLSGARALEPSTPVTEYVLASWTEKDGLPSAVVQAITQDHDGYLWLGTNVGLVRFDGVRFTNWQGAPLASTNIRSLAVGQDGSIWVGFYGQSSISRINAGDGRVTNYGEAQGVPAGTVQVLLADRSGDIWAGAAGGLARFHDNRWDAMALVQGAPEPTIHDLHADRQGLVWAVTSAGVFRQRAGGGAFELISPSPLVRGLTEDAGGAVWVTTRAQIAARLDPFDVAQGKPLDLARAGLLDPSSGVNGTAGNGGFRIWSDRHDNLWVGTEARGVVRVSHHEDSSRSRAESSELVMEYVTERQGLSNDSVRALFEDREGNIWLGTRHGLNRLSQGVVRRFPTRGDTLMSEPGRVVAVTGDGSVWVGTGAGLYRITGETTRRYDQPDGLPSADVTALHVDDRDVLWVATYPAAVARLVNGRFVPIAMPANAGLDRIFAMTTDRHGALWLSDTVGRLFRWSGNQLTPVPMSPSGRRWAMSAATDRRGRVWIGFNNGIGVYDGDRLEWYADGVRSELAGAMYEDPDGTVWIGTTAGLVRLDRGRLVTLGADSGIPASNVTAITGDDTGHLWIAARAGIVRVHRQELAKALADPAYRPPYVLFDRSDGLPGSPVWLAYPAAARGRDGRLWFVTSNGLAVIDTLHVPQPSRPPTVRIEEAVADRQIIDARPRLLLAAGTSSLQIDYTGFDFAAPERLRFRYRLDGFDTNWVDAGTRRQAFYTNLGPGTYRFHVMASNGSGWSASTAAWDFAIRPTYYQTGWFRAALIAIVILALCSAWWLRMRQVHARHAAVLGERARIGREIHDTLLQSLVGVSLQCNDVAQKVASPEIREQLERLRRQVDRYARDARHAIWNLHSNEAETRDLPTALRDAGERITEGQTVHFTYVLNGTPRPLAPESEEHLLRIGQEALANVMRHAGADNVRMEIEYGDSAVRLRIIDDGRGLAVADYETDKHWGLRIMQERAQRIGGHFQMKSQPGEGTAVEVVAPLAV